ncbi:hypothetical protein PGTUg99_033636 [Puccinia graminis f. sp. tritici]|uniref:Uncharacterized protein n=1 Tax=Puccinia graminis f. sp. tritici TaxID=56615 RepID=A0A5B0Q9U8_PUCGR|nr:hypothetical protein PGTUg99_033636 [Puccinia graminis f. sp. tritici]
MTLSCSKFASLKTTETKVSLVWMFTLISSVTAAFVAPLNHVVPSGNSVTAPVHIVKSTSSRTASRINAYPTRGGVATLETKELAPIKEGWSSNSVLTHSYLDNNHAENQKEISTLVKEFENCHGQVLLDKLQGLAVLHRSSAPKDASKFKIAARALFLTALSNKSQQKDIFQFFLEATGPVFGSLSTVDKVEHFENLGSRQLARETCRSLAKASIELKNYYISHLQSEIDKVLRHEITSNSLKDLIRPIVQTSAVRFLSKLRLNLYQTARKKLYCNDIFIVRLRLLLAYGKSCIELGPDSWKSDEVKDVFNILNNLLKMEGLPLEKQIATNRTKEALLQFARTEKQRSLFL